MHQAGAVLDRDVVGEHDEVGRHVLREGHQLERPLVGPPLHVAAGHGRLDRPALAEHGGEQRLGDDQRLGAVGGHDVVDLGVHRHGGVRHQRPGRGRPHQQGRPRRAGRGGVRPRRQREADVDRRVGHRLVALRELVVGEPGAAAGAVRRHPVVLDEAAGVEDLLQRPPDRLDVRRRHRDVGVVGVDPEAHPLRHLLERVDVPQHGLAALGVELRDAVGLDVALAGEAELLLHGELDGQTVAVPAGLPLDLEALHGLEPGEHVLEDTGLDVVGAGHAVGGRRALVERPARPAVAGVDRLVEGLVVLPEREHVVLQRGEVDLGAHRVVLRRLVLRRVGLRVLAHVCLHFVDHPTGVSGGACPVKGREAGRCPAAPAVPPSLATSGTSRPRQDALSRGHRGRFYLPVRVTGALPAAPG